MIEVGGGAISAGLAFVEKDASDQEGIRNPRDGLQADVGAVRVVPGAAGSKRRMLLRLMLLTLLSRFAVTKSPFVPAKVIPLMCLAGGPGLSARNQTEERAGAVSRTPKRTLVEPEFSYDKPLRLPLKRAAGPTAVTAAAPGRL